MVYRFYCIALFHSQTQRHMIKSNIGTTAILYVMRGSRKFCQKDSNFDSVFFCWLEDQNTTMRRFGWRNTECWLWGIVIFQGIWSSIAKKSYIFVIFQAVGVGSRHPAPSGSTHVCAYGKQSIHVETERLIRIIIIHRVWEWNNAMQ